MFVLCVLYVTTNGKIQDSQTKKQVRINYNQSTRKYKKKIPPDAWIFSVLLSKYKWQNTGNQDKEQVRMKYKQSTRE